MSGLAARRRLALSLALSCGAVASGCSFCADERFREPPPLSEADETQSREGGDHAGQATHD